MKNMDFLTTLLQSLIEKSPSERRSNVSKNCKKKPSLSPRAEKGDVYSTQSLTMSASFLSAMNTRAADAGQIADLISQSDFENIHRAFTDFDFDDDDDEEGLVDYVEEAIKES